MLVRGVLNARGLLSWKRASVLCWTRGVRASPLLPPNAEEVFCQVSPRAYQSGARPPELGVCLGKLLFICLAAVGPQPFRDMHSVGLSSDLAHMRQGQQFSPTYCDIEFYWDEVQEDKEKILHAIVPDQEIYLWW